MLTKIMCHYKQPSFKILAKFTVQKFGGSENYLFKIKK